MVLPNEINKTLVKNVKNLNTKSVSASLEVMKVEIIVAYWHKDKIISKDIISLIDYLSIDEMFEIYLIVNQEILNLEVVKNRVKTYKTHINGYDLNLYINGLLKVKNSNNLKILFNNSIRINSNEKFRQTLLLMAKGLLQHDIMTFAVSSERKKHAQSFLFGINPRIIPEISNFLESQKHTKFSRTEVIENFELESIQIMNQHNIKFESILKLNCLDKILGYSDFLFNFGFLDNWKGLFFPNKINYTIHLTNRIKNKFGFSKIKLTTSLINRLIEKSKKLSDSKK